MSSDDLPEIEKLTLREDGGLPSDTSEGTSVGTSVATSLGGTTFDGKDPEDDGLPVIDTSTLSPEEKIQLLRQTRLALRVYKVLYRASHFYSGRNDNIKYSQTMDKLRHGFQSVLNLPTTIDSERKRMSLMEYIVSTMGSFIDDSLHYTDADVGDGIVNKTDEKTLLQLYIAKQQIIDTLGGVATAGEAAFQSTEDTDRMILHILRLTEGGGSSSESAKYLGGQLKNKRDVEMYVSMRQKGSLRSSVHSSKAVRAIMMAQGTGNGTRVPHARRRLRHRVAEASNNVLVHNSELTQESHKTHDEVLQLLNKIASDEKVSHEEVVAKIDALANETRIRLRRAGRFAFLFQAECHSQAIWACLETCCHMDSSFEDKLEGVIDTLSERIDNAKSLIDKPQSVWSAERIAIRKELDVLKDQVSRLIKSSRNKHLSEHLDAVVRKGPLRMGKDEMDKFTRIANDISDTHDRANTHNRNLNEMVSDSAAKTHDRIAKRVKMDVKTMKRELHELAKSSVEQKE